MNLQSASDKSRQNNDESGHKPTEVVVKRRASHISYNDILLFEMMFLQIFMTKSLSIPTNQRGEAFGYG